jgi:ribosomal protein S4
MAKFFKSKFALTKRYSRFSNICVYFNKKPVRYGYKLYQKIFKRYKSGQNLRINVRKPRIAVKRKTSFGKAMEIKEKFSYLISGIHSSKLRRYCRLSRSKFFAPGDTFSARIEQRLDIILYRANIFLTPYQSRWFIKSGSVRINGLTVCNPSFKVKVNSNIDLQLIPYAYTNVFSNFTDSLKKRVIFKPEPAYIIGSYRLFRFIINDKAKQSSIFFPFDFNINYFYRLYSA